MTCDSRPDRGCFSTSFQRLLSFRHRCPPRHDWRGPCPTPVALPIWKYRTACPQSSAPPPVERSWPVGCWHEDTTPWLPARYRPFNATTDRSVPVPRIGTQALAITSLGPAPFASGRQVQRFHVQACSTLAPLQGRRPWRRPAEPPRH